MSFSGDLEHLPIVDVIQLLHTTRKSGTLCVRGRTGESQLVFKDGYIVSANHPNNSIRIGRLLAESGAITPEALEQALSLQQHATGPRRPLVALLIEGRALTREAAFKGLTALIEITIVEMLRNVRGTFALEVERFEVSDEFRYFPEHLQQELNLNTQMVLMDALRLFDERNRDGLENQPLFADESLKVDPETETGLLLSADDLGLAELDQLERQIPAVFAPIEEVDPGEHHRKALAEILTACPANQLDPFVDFLTTLTPAPAAEKQPRRILICFSPDPLLRHGVATLCQHLGLPVLTTSEEPDLVPILSQVSSRGTQPQLLLDAPEISDPEGVAAAAALLQRLRQDQGQHPLLQLVHPGDYQLPLLALRQGASMVLPRPALSPANPLLGPQLVATLELLRAAFANPGLAQATSPLGKWHQFHATLRDCNQPADISAALVQQVAGHFPRALTLLVGKGELIVERVVGFGPNAPPPRSRLTQSEPSLLRQCVENASCHFGPSSEPLLPAALLATIGAPRCASGLLLPLTMRDRTVALIYADFGSEEPSIVPLDLLQAMAQHAGLALENAIYRKQMGKPA